MALLLCCFPLAANFDIRVACDKEKHVFLCSRCGWGSFSLLTHTHTQQETRTANGKTKRLGSPLLHLSLRADLFHLSALLSLALASASMFVSSGSCYRTPTPTSREAQERVVRLAREERVRCFSAQPARRSSSSVKSAVRDNAAVPRYSNAKGGDVGAGAKTPSLANNDTQIAPPRVSTPTLKAMVYTGNQFTDDQLVRDLNGGSSPSRANSCRKSIEERAAEIARSASNSPVDRTAPSSALTGTWNAAPPRYASATESAPEYKGNASTPSSRPATAAARVAVATPLVLHTVGPREFARLRVKARSVSPWALHVESDLATYTEQNAAEKALQEQKKLLWVQSLAEAVEARKRETEKQRNEEKNEQLQTLAYAAAMQAAASESHRARLEAMAAARRDHFNSHLSRKESHSLFARQEQAAEAARNTQVLSDAAREQEIQAEVRRKKFEEAQLAAQRAHDRRKDEENRARQSQLEELQLSAKYWQEQEKKRAAFSATLNGSRAAIARRAASVAAQWRPTKKQQQLQRIEEDFERTSMNLLAYNMQLNDAARREAKHRALTASAERNRMVSQREQDLEVTKRRRLEEENESIARDRFERDVFEKAAAELKQQQRLEVRRMLDVQRILEMRRRLDEVGST